jgi:hypothetical protein
VASISSSRFSISSLRRSASSEGFLILRGLVDGIDLASQLISFGEEGWVEVDRRCSAAMSHITARISVVAGCHHSMLIAGNDCIAAKLWAKGDPTPVRPVSR